MAKRETKRIKPESPDRYPNLPVDSVASCEERAAKNRALFEDAGGDIWFLTVYEPVHGGWLFANIGGGRILDKIGSSAGLNESSKAVELCCGLGDTCCYLASRFGCRLTGIEINQTQFDRARANLFNRRAEVSDRVRLLREDVLDWKPEDSYDLVFAMDSLMYLPRREQILARVYNWLNAGGCLMLAEVLAGPRINEAARNFMWEKEGVIDLPSSAEQAEMVGRAGFTDTRQEDLTYLATDCFEKICAATYRHRETLIGIEGEALYQERLRDNEAYREFFLNGTLVYALTGGWR